MDATAKTPGEPKAHLNLGVAYGNRGEYRAAERQFRRAIELWPNYATAWHSLGMLCRVMGRLDESEVQLREAVRLNPSSAEAHNSLGVTLAARAQPEEALAEFQAAITLRPDYQEVRQNLGLTYEQLGQDDKALASYRLALGLMPPNDARLHCAMGDILLRAGRAGEAIVEYQAAVKSDASYGPAREALRNARGRKDGE
jgi:Tfp pilus assembly protein PilF